MFICLFMSYMIHIHTYMYNTYIVFKTIMIYSVALQEETRNENGYHFCKRMYSISLYLEHQWTNSSVVHWEYTYCQTIDIHTVKQSTYILSIDRHTYSQMIDMYTAKDRHTYWQMIDIYTVNRSTYILSNNTVELILLHR